MPGRRTDDNRSDILRKNEFRIKWTIKNEVELMFRMLNGHLFQCFITEPAYSLEFVFEQEPGIYSYFHGSIRKNSSYFLLCALCENLCALCVKYLFAKVEDS